MKIAEIIANYNTFIFFKLMLEKAESQFEKDNSNVLLKFFMFSISK